MGSSATASVRCRSRRTTSAASRVAYVASLCTGQHHALIQPSAIVRLLGDRPVNPLDLPVSAQTTGADQNLLISRAPFLIQYYGSTNVSSADEPVPAQSTHDRHGLVGP